MRHLVHGRKLHPRLRSRCDVLVHGVQMKRAVLLVCLLGGMARADDKADARAAYERGTAAYKRKDYQAAAAEYTRADTLAPNPVALQAALDATVQADDPVLGSELLERALARRAEGQLAKSIEAARAKFSGRAGRLTVVCMDCSATLDGTAITTGTAHWTKAGPHAVVITRGASNESKTVQVDGGATVEVSPTPPPKVEPKIEPKVEPKIEPKVEPDPPPPVVVVQSEKPIEKPAERSGISPVWFFAGLGATAAFGIVSIAVGADVVDRHAKFVKSGCDRMDVGDCRKQADAGSTEAAVASVFIGGTIAFGAATILSIFFVQWKSPVRPAAAIGPTGGWAGLNGSF
jgi:hypothetical protein